MLVGMVVRRERRADGEFGVDLSEGISRDASGDSELVKSLHSERTLPNRCREGASGKSQNDGDG